MIMNDKTEDMQKIRNIEDRYGLQLFGMGLTHLFVEGHKNFTDESVENDIQQIMAKGKVSIMTPEFQCAILNCAAELAKFTPFTLFAYIKKYVEIGGVY